MTPSCPAVVASLPAEIPATPESKPPATSIMAVDVAIEPQFSWVLAVPVHSAAIVISCCFDVLEQSLNSIFHKVPKQDLF